MNTNKAYTTGLVSEQELIKHLDSLGVGVTPSTKEENVFQDIDCWVDGRPISIKTQHTCLRTGNLAFELSVFDKRGNVSDGWFRSGEAVEYYIIVGSQLYRILKSQVIDYVVKHGWHRQTRLKQATKDSQIAINHRHRDALVGLIKLDRLLDNGLTWVCELPDLKV